MKYSSLFLALIFLSANAWSQCYQPNIKEADKAFDAGKFKEAKSLYQKALRCPDAKNFNEGQTAKKGIRKCDKRLQNAKEGIRKCPERLQKPNRTSSLPNPTDMVNVEPNSRYKYDVIASFSVNLASASQFAKKLFDRGLHNVYIIKRSDVYYVSMGGSDNRAGIQGMYDYMKYWCRENDDLISEGNILIKEW